MRWLIIYTVKVEALKFQEQALASAAHCRMTEAHAPQPIVRMNCPHGDILINMIGLMYMMNMMDMMFCYTQHPAHCREDPPARLSNFPSSLTTFLLLFLT
jgi:hypothetical protein